MPVERRNPLPAGHYWVNIPPSDALAFNVWKADHREAVKVRTISTGEDGWEWHLFDVETPVEWGDFGFPNIAEAGIDGPEDVYQVPHIEQPRPEQIVSNALWGIGAILLAAVALNRILR